MEQIREYLLTAYEAVDEARARVVALLQHSRDKEALSTLLVGTYTDQACISTISLELNELIGRIKNMEDAADEDWG
jgi:hypothetical protein